MFLPFRQSHQSDHFWEPRAHPDGVLQRKSRESLLHPRLAHCPKSYWIRRRHSREILHLRGLLLGHLQGEIWEIRKGQYLQLRKKTRIREYRWVFLVNNLEKRSPLLNRIRLKKDKNPCPYLSKLYFTGFSLSKLFFRHLEMEFEIDAASLRWVPRSGRMVEECSEGGLL